MTVTPVTTAKTPSIAPTLNNSIAPQQPTFTNNPQLQPINKSTPIVETSTSVTPIASETIHLNTPKPSTQLPQTGDAPTNHNLALLRLTTTTLLALLGTTSDRKKTYIKTFNGRH